MCPQATCWEHRVDMMVVQAEDKKSTFSNKEQTPTHLDLQTKEVNIAMQMDIEKPKVSDMLANVCMQIDVAMPTNTMMQFDFNMFAYDIHLVDQQVHMNMLVESLCTPRCNLFQTWEDVWKIIMATTQHTRDWECHQQ